VLRALTRLVGSPSSRAGGLTDAGSLCFYNPSQDVLGNRAGATTWRRRLVDASSERHHVADRDDARVCQGRQLRR
jgi:hypothetical protein